MCWSPASHACIHASAECCYSVSTWHNTLRNSIVHVVKMIIIQAGSSRLTQRHMGTNATGWVGDTGHRNTVHEVCSKWHLVWKLEAAANTRCRQDNAKQWIKQVRRDVYAVLGLRKWRQGDQESKTATSEVQGSWDFVNHPIKSLKSKMSHCGDGHRLAGCTASFLLQLPQDFLQLDKDSITGYDKIALFSLLW